jgi:carboxymethylenebutenolidase
VRKRNPLGGRLPVRNGLGMTAANDGGRMAVGETIRMTMSDGADIAVYHVEPTGERRGGLVLVQEIFGVTDHIRDMANDYAEDGYEVLAPALFDREHPGFEAAYGGEGLAEGVRLAREAHPFALSLADVQTCIDALSARGPVFVVGYCYGGSIAWFAATQMHGVAAASSYYGSLVPGAADQEPKVPIALHFGRYDGSIPLEGVDRLIEQAWDNADIYIYDAGHGFNSDRRKDFHEPSCDLARERTLELFRANGG